MTARGSGGDSGWRSPLPKVIQGLRRVVEVIERWPRGPLPGKLSKGLYEGPTDSSLTAEAQGQHRWIECRVFGYRGTAWIRLSTFQALQLAAELERAPQVAQEMISSLKSMNEG